jgi:signal peptidase II
MSEPAPKSTATNDATAERNPLAGASSGAAPSIGEISSDGPAGRSVTAWCTLLGVLSVGLFIDLWTKYWSFENVAGRPVELRYEDVAGNPNYRLPWHEGIRVLPWDLLDFRLVLNHGAVFGVGQNRQRVFIAFTLVAVTVAIWFFAKWTRRSSRLAHVAVGLIMAGGLGNLYDRVVYGAVRDFLHMLPRWELPFGLRWWGNATNEVFPWIFNIADVMLLAGMTLFMIFAIRHDLDERRQAQSVQPAQPAQSS